MNNKITQTIKKFNMLSNGDNVLLAVSGGADSMLMLNYFVNNEKELGVSIKVAHIEHGIRGQASIDDALFVKCFCENNGIEYHQLNIDAVNEAKESRLGVEEYSRNKRYEFFDTIKCDKIATAHNLTDNIETITFRAVRGSGLKGICGIPAVRGKIIRPLIELSSSEIRSYCDNNNIEYRVDLSNLDSNYSRNKIRNKVMPKLMEINPNFENKISALINDVNEVYDFVESFADENYKLALEDDKLNKEYLSKLPSVIVKEILIKYFESHSISLDRLHIEEVNKLLHKTGKYQIEGYSFAVSDQKYLRYANFQPSDICLDYDYQILNINEFIATNVDFYFDYDKITGKLFFRKRQEGDCITPANRNCSKSLKKLFNELKIPVEKRDAVPIICDDLGAVAIFGYCVDERVKLDSTTKNVITFKFPLED